MTNKTNCTDDNTVHLTYFKPSGKYYSSGSFKVYGDKHIAEISEVVRALMQERRLPELVEGHSDFDVLVEYKGVPCLIRAATQPQQSCEAIPCCGKCAAGKDVKIEYVQQPTDAKRSEAFSEKEIADMAQAISDNGFQYEANKSRIKAALQSPAVPREVLETEFIEACQKYFIFSNVKAIMRLIKRLYPDGIKLKGEA